MLLSAKFLTLAAILSTQACARPLDAPKARDVARSKSYAIINVDGGATETSGPAPATTIPRESKSIEVVNPGPTSSQRASSVAAQPTSTSASTVSISTPVETPKPIVVTVTVSQAAGPTEYYDDGMWHTLYRIKTFEAAQITSTFSSSNATATITTASILASTVV